MTFSKLAVRRDNAELFLAGEDLLAKFVPPLVELAFVFVDPLLTHVMRSMRCSWREIEKNGLSGINAFCWRIHLMALFVMSSVK